MKIGADNLYAEMQSMALKANQTIRPEISVESTQAVNPSTNQFGDLLSRAINNVNDLGHSAKEITNRFELGDTNVSLADVMIAKEKSSLAFEATVQVRNKVLEAYEKIMQMPV
ncbi:flagellar hook-basal body complex protein FliE [Catenovulum maritimum]|uniref:Flagellar hook-basal body complex protein FliE n=1 Tax=Catenovulum maritimum TaxID=1513271 RepID=A0A0J8GUB1_9ALTE|nr:flagellar hook-basal body complex protein FliE [Catenovulum maritimum]KMT64899.1 flagellar hook-basal body protein FliE [Catenovulum maritimum]